MKKRIILRLLAALTALITAASLSTGAFALQEEAAQPAVARMSIYVYVKTPVSRGHAWVYFENISQEDINIGLMTVSPGEGVSLGTFFISRSDGAGLYYNIEAYCAGRFGADGCVSLTQDITAEQLAAANKAIAGGNHWDPIFNCAYFAMRVWNSAGAVRVSTAPFPWFLKPAVANKGGERSRPMLSPEGDRVFKQKGSGDGAYLKAVSEGSLSHGL